MININGASVEEIVEAGLPGIGRELASRIVAYRDAVGPFGTVEELAAVDGITGEMVRRFRDRIVLSEEDLAVEEPAGLFVTMTGTRCSGGRCLGHRLTARFEREVAGLDGTSRWVEDEASAFFDEYGSATLELPGRDCLRGEVGVVVSAPDGSGSF